MTRVIDNLCLNDLAADERVPLHEISMTLACPVRPTTSYVITVGLCSVSIAIRVCECLVGRLRCKEALGVVLAIFWYLLGPFVFFFSLFFPILFVWFQALKIVRKVTGGGCSIHLDFTEA